MNNNTIFIVEDSATQSERLKNMLEQHDYSVVAAKNGQDALNKLTQMEEQPVLLISDIVMPEMDGYELCKHIRKNPELKKLPIILLTTLSDTEYIVKALECGANYFLTKPYEEEQLITHIKNTLDIQKIRSSESGNSQTKILVNSHEYVIAAEKAQILDLLVSIYNTAILKNQQLESAQLQLQEFNVSLEDKIEQRTAQLQESLEEKKVLLREIYHRVKNNLQVVSSLLGLQIDSIQDPSLQGILLENVARIKSMALVHNMLYDSENLTKISMRNYIENLFDYFYHIYSVDTDRIALVLDIQDISLGIDIAIPCGLIINELISNAFKYAFPEKASGKIQVSLTPEDGHAVLIISDNGIGIPETLDIEKTESLGISLIRNLTRQLNGTMVLERQHGTRFIIHFSQTR